MAPTGIRAQLDAQGAATGFSSFANNSAPTGSTIPQTAANAAQAQLGQNQPGYNPARQNIAQQGQAAINNMMAGKPPPGAKSVEGDVLDGLWNWGWGTAFNDAGSTALGKAQYNQFYNGSPAGQAFQVAAGITGQMPAQSSQVQGQIGPSAQAAAMDAGLQRQQEAFLGNLPGLAGMNGARDAELIAQLLSNQRKGAFAGEEHRIGEGEARNNFDFKMRDVDRQLGNEGRDRGFIDKERGYLGEALNIALGGRGLDERDLERTYARDKRHLESEHIAGGSWFSPEMRLSRGELADARDTGLGRINYGRQSDDLGYRRGMTNLDQQSASLDDRFAGLRDQRGYLGNALNYALARNNLGYANTIDDLGVAQAGLYRQGAQNRYQDFQNLYGYASQQGWNLDQQLPGLSFNLGDLMGAYYSGDPTKQWMIDMYQYRQGGQAPSGANWSF